MGSRILPSNVRTRSSSHHCLPEKVESLVLKRKAERKGGSVATDQNPDSIRPNGARRTSRTRKKLSTWKASSPGTSDFSVQRCGRLALWKIWKERPTIAGPNNGEIIQCDPEVGVGYNSVCVCATYPRRIAQHSHVHCKQGERGGRTPPCKGEEWTNASRQ